MLKINCFTTYPFCRGVSASKQNHNFSHKSVLAFAFRLGLCFWNEYANHPYLPCFHSSCRAALECVNCLPNHRSWVFQGAAGTAHFTVGICSPQWSQPGKTLLWTCIQQGFLKRNMASSPWDTVIDHVNCSKLHVGKHGLDNRKHFLTERLINYWNRLPRGMDDAPSLWGLKRLLDSALNNML